MHLLRKFCTTCFLGHVSKIIKKNVLASVLIAHDLTLPFFVALFLIKNLFLTVKLTTWHLVLEIWQCLWPDKQIFHLIQFKNISYRRRTYTDYIWVRGYDNTYEYHMKLFTADQNFMSMIAIIIFIINDIYTRYDRLSINIHGLFIIQNKQ